MGNITLEQIIILSVILLVIFLLLLFFLIVLGNIKKVRKGVKETNESSKLTSSRIEHLDSQIQQLNQDNKEVIRVHKQIKDKSEAMNKMLEQTNKIYKEVLDKQTEFNVGDNHSFLDLNLEQVKGRPERKQSKINYEEINSPNSQEAGAHLTQILNNINSDKEQINNKISVEEEPVVKSNTTVDAFTKVDLENIKKMNKEEVYKLLLSLKDYKIILSKEEEYYLEQIELINQNKSDYTQEQRLKRKEFIYKGIKEVEEKIQYQKTLLEEVKKRKKKIQKSEEQEEKEKELDSLINGIVRKR